MPLFERVKEIIKKFEFIITAIILAAGTVIGTVIGAITNALKALGKGVAKGLQDIGKKNPASLLPRLISSIVSFIFIAAGQAISFLAEHTWLIILAVVASFTKNFLKRFQTNRTVKTTAPTTINTLFLSWLVVAGVGSGGAGGVGEMDI